MKKYFFLLCVLGFSFNIKAQKYFNRIIPFEFGNPTPVHLIFFDNSILIPTIYPPSESFDQSTIIEIPFNNSVSFHHIQNFDFAAKSINLNEDHLFLFGKNRSNNKDLRFISMDYSYNIDWNNEILTAGEYNFPSSSILFSNNTYNSFFFIEDDRYKIGLNKTNTESGTVWTKAYEDNIGYSYPWSLIQSLDNQLLYSYTLSYKDEFIGNAYVMKIDTSGEVIWRTEPMELIDGGAAPIHISELSDGNIIVTYRKNMWYVYEWNCCLVPYTPTFILLDQDGNILQENVLKLDKKENAIFSDLKSGSGDYYFGYGRRQYDAESPGIRDFYGFITKYDNNGDTIWSRLYRHPDFDEESMSHYIKDIVELDNGDIVAMGSITPIGDQSEIWYFKVDANGCLDSYNCDDVQILTSVGEISDSSDDLKLFPNPVADKLFIESSATSIKKVTVLDMNGKVQKDIYFDLSSKTIDVSELPQGLYAVKVDTNEGHVSIRKFIKL